MMNLNLLLVCLTFASINWVLGVSFYLSLSPKVRELSLFSFFGFHLNHPDLYTTNHAHCCRHRRHSNPRNRTKPLDWQFENPPGGDSKHQHRRPFGHLLTSQKQADILHIHQSSQFSPAHTT
ncbi:hypothetical protein QBC45DRAFT_114370 [Copromyces sp. CBS 386.78]|nr:hypothetical protein QBC45DRAFT_114370 [Copromyces sp. CBS 386.78]